MSRTLLSRLRGTAPAHAMDHPVSPAPDRPVLARPGLVLLSVRVQRDTARRVAAAAKRIDQPVAAWLRMAIIEKLQRDG